MSVIEPLLLSTVRICTYAGPRLLTNASGFFFARDERLFLVTSRHVMVDASGRHFPDRLEIELHTDRHNMARSCGFSVPLYRDGKSLWRQGRDTAGGVDVALIELERAALPSAVVYHAFTPGHLQAPSDLIEVGTALLVVGFPWVSTTTCITCRWCGMPLLPLRSACVSRGRAISSPTRARTAAQAARRW